VVGGNRYDLGLDEVSSRHSRHSHFMLNYGEACFDVTISIVSIGLWLLRGSILIYCDRQGPIDLERRLTITKSQPLVGSLPSYSHHTGSINFDLKPRNGVTYLASNLVLFKKDVIPIRFAPFMNHEVIVVGGHIDDFDAISNWTSRKNSVITTSR